MINNNGGPNMAPSESLVEILQQFSLEKYFDAFNSVGIRSKSHLLALTMQDYPTLGITSMQDRRKMFHLIQNIKDKEKITTPLKHKGHHFVKRAENSENCCPEERSSNNPFQQKIAPKREQTTTTPNKHNFNYGIPSSKKKPLTSKTKTFIDGPSNIKVCVRKRPLGRNDIEEGETDIVDVEVKNSEVIINAPKVAVDLTKFMQKFSFVFDDVFDESFSNQQVYEKTAKLLVNAIFTRGAKATCFAYGCTGSGKTYTMLGTDNTPGLYLLAASDIFNVLYSGSHGDDLDLWVSFYEIYCGQLFDLLNNREKLFARENANHQVCIVGLTELQVKNVEELMEVIENGSNTRSTGSTGVNSDSSRSHAILQLEIKNKQERLGRFSFIDLAGSERAADVTDTDKQTRMEGAEINQSLLALKECIRSLDQDSKHTPFRQSKLTQVLKDSFIGNTSTCMIANVSPCQSSCENTLNTLRYADRVKELNKSVPSPLSPRPVTVHGNNGTTDHKTQITAMKNKPLGKSLNISSTNKNDSEKARKVILTPKTKQNVHKCLEIPQNSPRQKYLLSRPETSPASIKESGYKQRTQSRLHERSKEQSYNMQQTRQEAKQMPTKNKTTRNILTAQTNVKNDIPQTKQFGSGHNEKGKTLTASNIRFAGNRRKHEQRNRLEVLPKETINVDESLAVPNNLSLLTNSDDKDKSKMKQLTESEETSHCKPLKNTVVHELKDRPKSSKFKPKGKQTFQKRQNVEQSKDQSVIRSTNPKQNNKKYDILMLDEQDRSLQSNDKLFPEEENTVSHEEKCTLEQKETMYQRNVKTLPNTSQSNHRYSKGIKARIAQLFTNKPTGGLNDNQETLLSTARSHGHEIPESPQHRVISQEQLVAAHHTQLAMITSLCHEEMVLLKQRDNQDFQEYVSQVEEILTQKQTCINTLQEKLKHWKATSLK